MTTEINTITKAQIKKSCNSESVFVKTSSNEYRSDTIEIDGVRFLPDDFETTHLEEVKVESISLGRDEISITTPN